MTDSNPTFVTIGATLSPSFTQSFARANHLAGGFSQTLRGVGTASLGVDRELRNTLGTITQLGATTGRLSTLNQGLGSSLRTVGLGLREVHGALGIVIPQAMRLTTAVTANTDAFRRFNTAGTQTARTLREVMLNLEAANRAQTTSASSTERSTRAIRQQQAALAALAREEQAITSARHRRIAQGMGPDASSRMVQWMSVAGASEMAAIAQQQHEDMRRAAYWSRMGRQGAGPLDRMAVGMGDGAKYNPVFGSTTPSEMIRRMAPGASERMIAGMSAYGAGMAAAGGAGGAAGGGGRGWFGGGLGGLAGHGAFHAAFGAVGPAIVAGYAVHKLFKSGADTADNLTLMRLQGMKPEEINNALAESIKVSKDIRSIGIGENLKAIREYRAAFLHSGDAVKHLRGIQTATAIMGAVNPNIDASDNAFQMAKALELKGITDPKMFEKYLEGMTKATIATGGRVTGADFAQYARLARGAPRAQSLDFYAGIMPTIIQEMNAASAGQAISTLSRAIAGGRMDKQAKTMLTNLGIFRGGRVQNAQLFNENPFEWVQQVVKPILEQRGVMRYGKDGNITRESQSDITTLFAQAFSNRSVGQMMSILLTQAPRLRAQMERWSQAVGGEKGLEMIQNMPGVAWHNFTTGFVNLLQAVSGPFMGTASRTLNLFADSFNALAGPLNTILTPIGKMTEGVVALAQAISKPWGLWLSVLSSGLNQLFSMVKGWANWLKSFLPASMTEDGGDPNVSPSQKTIRALEKEGWMSDAYRARVGMRPGAMQRIDAAGAGQDFEAPEDTVGELRANENRLTYIQDALSKTTDPEQRSKLIEEERKIIDYDTALRKKAGVGGAILPDRVTQRRAQKAQNDNDRASAGRIATDPFMKKGVGAGAQGIIGNVTPMPPRRPRGLGRGAGRAMGAPRSVEGVPYSANELSGALGTSPDKVRKFSGVMAGIESGGKYGLMGGAGRSYAGRYQIGRNELRETARSLGVPVPSQQEFLNNPEMQERFFERYTLNHHKYLMAKSPEYRALSPEDKLAALGYAHNQGAGDSEVTTRSGVHIVGAARWLKTGRGGADAFGTGGTKYSNAIKKALGQSGSAAVGSAYKDRRSSAGGGNRQFSNNVNAPITIHAQAHHNEREIASMVKRDLERFADPGRAMRSHTFDWMG